MATAFDFDSFYDFIEVIHELKFFLQGEAGISPFNYLDAYHFIRKSVDDCDTSSDALFTLNHAICHLDTTHPSFGSARGGKTTAMKEDILSFIDLLDEWRVSLSRFYGLPKVVNHSYAFCLLCEMYCDENEPAYTAIYSWERLKIEDALPPKTKKQIKEAVGQIREFHFTKVSDDIPKDKGQLEDEISEARQRLLDWEKNNGTPSFRLQDDPFQRSRLTRQMLSHLGLISS